MILTCTGCLGKIVNFHYFDISPSQALWAATWLYRNWPNWPANRSDCTLVLR